MDKLILVRQLVGDYSMGLIQLAQGVLKDQSGQPRFPMGKLRDLRVLHESLLVFRRPRHRSLKGRIWCEELNNQCKPDRAPRRLERQCLCRA